MMIDRKKMLLAFLAVTAMTGAVSAADQTVEPSQNARDAVVSSTDSSTSQSSMVSLNKRPIVGDAGSKIDSAAASVAPQEITMGGNTDDPYLYLSENDVATVQSMVGKTVTSVDVTNVPDSVKSSLMPLLFTRVGDSLSLASVESDVSALGSTGVFSRISPQLTGEIGRAHV